MTISWIPITLAGIASWIGGAIILAVELGPFALIGLCLMLVGIELRDIAEGKRKSK